MKKSTIISGLTATALALATGVALLSFSAAPCACESPGVLLLASAGLPTSTPRDLSLDEGQGAHPWQPERSG